MSGGGGGEEALTTTSPTREALQQAREEHARLRRELEALQQAQEVAKDRARIAIENLVSENKKLLAEVTSLEAKAGDLRRERVELLQQLRSPASPHKPAH